MNVLGLAGIQLWAKNVLLRLSVWRYVLLIMFFVLVDKTD